MKDKSLIITSLHSKIEKLVQLHNKLKDDYDKLADEHTLIIRKVEDQKNYTKELEEKNKVIKLANSISEKGYAPADVKTTINELVREIDRSIALLNK